MKRFLAAMVAAVGAATSAHADVEHIGQFALFRKYNAVLLSGPIDAETGYDFDRVLTEMPDVNTIALNSPGGQVVGALNVAKKVNLLGLNTVILRDMSCASACSIIFFAGNGREVQGDLGVHQMSSDRSTGIGAVQ